MPYFYYVDHLLSQKWPGLHKRGSYRNSRKIEGVWWAELEAEKSNKEAMQALYCKWRLIWYFKQDLELTILPCIRPDGKLTSMLFSERNCIQACSLTVWCLYSWKWQLTWAASSVTLPIVSLRSLVTWSGWLWTFDPSESGVLLQEIILLLFFLLRKVLGCALVLRIHVPGPCSVSWSSLLPPFLLILDPFAWCRILDHQPNSNFTFPLILLQV